MKMLTSTPTALAATMAEVIYIQVNGGGDPPTVTGATVYVCSRPPFLNPPPLAPTACPLATNGMAPKITYTFFGSSYSREVPQFTPCVWFTSATSPVPPLNFAIRLITTGGVGLWRLTITNTFTHVSQSVVKLTGLDPTGSYPDCNGCTEISISL